MVSCVISCRLKSFKFICGVVLAAALGFGPWVARADDLKPAGSAGTGVKPDLLATCPVCGDKLASIAKPYVFVCQGQEVKLCCAKCRKEFDKDPARYLKQIQDAANAAQK
jgi:YHS domain-containing protein